MAKTLQIFSKKKGAVNGNLRALIICYIICKLYYMLSKMAQKLIVIIILYITNINYSGLIFSLVLGFWEVISFFTFSGAQSSTTDSLLPTDVSFLPSLVSVTGGTSSGDTNLHFFVHEQGKYIQIGQCCVIVEMHVNDQTMERLKAQGTLEGQNHCPPRLPFPSLLTILSENTLTCQSITYLWNWYKGKPPILFHSHIIFF